VQRAGRLRGKLIELAEQTGADWDEAASGRVRPCLAAGVARSASLARGVDAVQQYWPTRTGRCDGATQNHELGATVTGTGTGVQRPQTPTRTRTRLHRGPHSTVCASAALAARWRRRGRCPGTSRATRRSRTTPSGPPPRWRYTIACSVQVIGAEAAASHE
jgi:hypothetical protein